MIAPVDAWLRDSLDFLAAIQFTERGLAGLRAAPVDLVPAASVSRERGPRIVIPVDLDTPMQPSPAWRVRFGATVLRLWNPTECPGSDWHAVPSDSDRLWWRHPSGTLTPAWNCWANARDLLTFREERIIAERDAHGRFPAAASPRFAIGVLDVPAVNDTNAVLLDAALSLGDRQPPRLQLPTGVVRPAGVALSHDCDQLRGNDAITQAIRLAHAITQAFAGNFSQAGRHLVAIVRNGIAPKRFFAANVAGMMDLERQFGFSSVCYLLTGKGGRFGARTGNATVRQLVSQLPAGWEAGTHYNYWTTGCARRLHDEMRAAAFNPAVSVPAGRAHYLRFDPLSSPRFVQNGGIRYDESIGWASHLSYRAGIAGPFHPFDEAAGAPMQLLELPLTCMDAALAETSVEQGFLRLYDHLNVVGGLMSILIHPGAFFNLEYPRYSGLYNRILSEVFIRGGRSWTPSELLAFDAQFHRR